MIVACLAGEFDEDSNHSAHKWLRLIEAVGEHVEQGEVVECRGDARMVFGKGGFDYGERAPNKWLRFGDAVGDLEERGEVVKVAGDVWMVLAEGGFGYGEGTAQERLRLGEAVGGLEELGEIVEVNGDVGMLFAEGGSSMARARRMSGSAWRSGWWPGGVRRGC